MNLRKLLPLAAGVLLFSAGGAGAISAGGAGTQEISSGTLTFSDSSDFSNGGGFLSVGTLPTGMSFSCTTFDPNNSTCQAGEITFADYTFSSPITLNDFLTLNGGSNGETTTMEADDINGEGGTASATTAAFNNCGSPACTFAPISVVLNDVEFTFSDGTTGENLNIAVPEPATLALLGTALAGIGVIRRRRRA